MSEENEIFFQRKIEFPSDKTRIPFGQNFRLTRIHKKRPTQSQCNTLRPVGQQYNSPQNAYSFIQAFTISAT